MHRAEITEQKTTLEKFQDSEIKTIVAQAVGKTGDSSAQLMFACGYASRPVKGDRLVLTQIGEAFYAVGGCNEKLMEELGLSDGESCIFSTDTDGDLKSITKYRADGAVITTNDNGMYQLTQDGKLSVGGGSDPVAMSAAVDQFITFIDSFLLASVDPLTGGAYSSAKTAAYPTGTIPTTGSDNLIADPIPLIPEP